MIVVKVFAVFGVLIAACVAYFLITTFIGWLLTCAKRDDPYPDMTFWLMVAWLIGMLLFAGAVVRDYIIFITG